MVNRRFSAKALHCDKRHANAGPGLHFGKVLGHFLVIWGNKGVRELFFRRRNFALNKSMRLKEKSRQQASASPWSYIQNPQPLGPGPGPGPGARPAPGPAPGPGAVRNQGPGPYDRTSERNRSRSRAEARWRIFPQNNEIAQNRFQNFWGVVFQKKRPPPGMSRLSSQSFFLQKINDFQVLGQKFYLFPKMTWWIMMPDIISIHLVP